MRIGSAKQTYAADEAIFKTNVQRAWFAALALALILFPFIASDYWQLLACLIAINIVAAMGLMILTGFTGLVSLGHAAFMGVGAYTAAYLSNHLALPFWLTIPAGGFVAAARRRGVRHSEPACERSLSRADHNRRVLHSAIDLLQLDFCHRRRARIDDRAGELLRPRTRDAGRDLLDRHADRRADRVVGAQSLAHACRARLHRHSRSRYLGGAARHRAPALQADELCAGFVLRRHGRRALGLSLPRHHAGELSG